MIGKMVTNERREGGSGCGGSIRGCGGVGQVRGAAGTPWRALYVRRVGQVAGLPTVSGRDRRGAWSGLT